MRKANVLISLANSGKRPVQVVQAIIVPILAGFLLLAGTTAASGQSQQAAGKMNPEGMPTPLTSSASTPQDKLWEAFDANRALGEAKAIADIGPRPSGSDANQAVRKYISDHLSALEWAVTEQRLTVHAPDGNAVEFCNLSARFTKSEAPAKRILIGAHFDTFSSQEFRDPGASDGAANTAILLEIARTLARDPKMAAGVELLFIDGEMPFHELNLSDGLFGSRYYTQLLRDGQHTSDIQAAILVENAGGAHVNYLPNGSPNLIESLKRAGAALGFAIERANRSMLADHVPFLQVGIPSITILDADSPFLETADDTTDHLDAGSLAKTGTLILYFIAAETPIR